MHFPPAGGMLAGVAVKHPTGGWDALLSLCMRGGSCSGGAVMSLKHSTRLLLHAACLFLLPFVVAAADATEAHKERPTGGWDAGLRGSSASPTGGWDG